MPSPIWRRMYRPSALSGGNGAHSSCSATPSSRRKAASCSPVSCAPWFSGSPANGQPPPLQGPREDGHRPVGHAVRFRERFHDRVQIVAAHVGEQRGDLRVAQRLEPRGRLGRRALAEGLPRGGGRQPEQRVVLEVPHGLEPLSEPAPPGWAKAPARGAGRSAVMTTCHPSARNRRSSCWLRWSPTTRSRLCRFRSTTTTWPRRSAIASSVHASQTLPSSSSASPTTAMFRAGPATGGCPGSASPAPPNRSLEIAVHEGREAGRHGPEPHRPRGEVEPVRVLRAARIRLEPAEGPVHVEALRRQEPSQDLDRVEDGRGRGLDRDPVARAHDLEVERGEERERRGRARLVPAHALRRRVRPSAVRVVDGIGGEPEQPVLDAEQEPAFLVGETRAHGAGRHGSLIIPRAAVSSPHHRITNRRVPRGRSAVHVRRSRARCAGRDSPGSHELRRSRVQHVRSRRVRARHGSDGRGPLAPRHRPRPDLERVQPLPPPSARGRRGRQARRVAGGRPPARVPDHLARRDLPVAHQHAVPEPHGDGHRGDDPRPADGRRRAPGRVRQDPARPAHGRGERRPAGDRRDRGPHAHRPLRGDAARRVHGLPPSLDGASGRRDRRAPHGGDPGRALPLHRHLHGHGHRQHDGGDDRGTRDDAPRHGGHSRRRSPAACGWRRRPAAGSSRWRARTSGPRGS